MAQVETVGGGISYTSDGKKLTKQVYVLSDGTNTVSPTVVSGAEIVSADFVQGEGGTTRVTVTWSQGQEGSGSLGGSSKSTELIGGSREVPIEGHPTFKNAVTEAQLKEIKRAISNDTDPDTAIVPTIATNKARILYKLLLRGNEYYLAPAVSYRETTLESNTPTLRELCTVNAPNNTPAVGPKQNWLLTSINYRSVARPTGAVGYEITREWMLSDRNGWDPEKVLYDGT